MNKFTPHERRALLRPAKHAFLAGRYFTALLYAALAPLALFSPRREERSLASDVYVMF